MEECINVVFLSIWNNSDKFNGDSNDFKKWICAVAKFKSIDYYRKASKKMEPTSNYMELNAGISAEDELIMLENRTELINLINHLEPVERDIFIMKFFLGFKTEDISTKLGLTKASVDNRIYRGKKKLSKRARNLMLGENGI
ncbi:sigma-70 family RNA polymerase sigma factor [Brevibacillus laterosporus]|uniref:Sigma-70 family RNA polymerase sigma factor n=1 Tax=Brevibacillus laterosporus TaxID=1465 RepID=A0A518V6V8_BRELA|nr:sigma-70 family RNA polymerase sigma factor [Brevibacillus laterosporus]